MRFLEVAYAPYHVEDCRWNEKQTGNCATQYRLRILEYGVERVGRASQSTDGLLGSLFVLVGEQREGHPSPNR